MTDVFETFLSQKPTILVADDDPQTSEMYQSTLRWFGYRVLAARGGVECLPIIRRESPDVIIVSVDLKWGGVDGLIDFLQHDLLRSRLPSVILTGFVDAERVAELPCVVTYLRKPFLMQRLLDTVRSVESEQHQERKLEPQFV